MSYYGKQIGWIDCSINYGREHIKAFCEMAQPYHSVVDLGAGGGHDLLIAKQVNPAAILHAIDANEVYAQQLVERGLTVHVLNVEHDKLPFVDGSVDLIIANQFLEHTKEIFWIFHEMSRVLTIGGKLIIGVPNLVSLHNRILVLLGHPPTSLRTNSAHVRGFTRPDLLLFLKSIFPQGYALLDCRGSNFYPFPPVLATPLARLFPTMAWGLFFLFEKKRPYSGEFRLAPAQQELETNFFVGE